MGLVTSEHPENHRTLLEREAELASIDRALEGAAAGSGRVLLLEGAAGVGKSTLAAAAQRAASERGFAVAAARATDIAQPFPYGVALQLFGPFVSDLDEDTLQQLFHGSARFSRSLFFEPQGEDDLSDPQGLAHNHGLYWLGANLSEQRPMLLVVDDAHWSDAASMRFLLYLSHRIESDSIVLIICSRPGEQDAAAIMNQLRTHPSAHELRPRPLSVAGTIALLESWGYETADDETADLVHGLTGGNPFSIRQLMEQLKERGTSTLIHDEIVGLSPTNVERSVSERLGKLGPHATALAHAIAVLGYDATLEHARELAGLSAEGTEEALTGLIEAEIIQEGPLLEFVHPLISSAVYDTIPKDERPQRHSAVAMLLLQQGEAIEKVASHLLLGDVENDGISHVFLRDAGKLAMKKGSPESAVMFFHRALASTNDPQDKAEVLAELAEAEAMTDPGSALEHLQEAVTLKDDPLERAHVYRRIGHVLYGLGQPAEAARFFKTALSELEDENSQLGIELSTDYISVARLDLSLRPQALAVFEELRARDVVKTDPPRRFLIEIAAALIRDGDDHREAIKTLKRGIPSLQQPLEENADGSLLPPLVTCLGWVDELDLAIQINNASIEDARQRGSIMAFATGQCFAAMALFRTGQVDEAIASAQSAIEAEQYGWGVASHLAKAWLAHALIDRNELDEADQVIAQALANPKIESSIQKMFVLEALARLRVFQSRPEEARAAALEAKQLATAFGTENPAIVSWRIPLSQSLAALGDRSTAVEIADEDVALSRRFGAPSFLARGLRNRGLLDEGKTGLDLLEEAIAVANGSAAVLTRAWAQLEFGRALTKVGDLPKARAALAEALRIADLCGSRIVEEIARKALLEAGARPRRKEVTGLGSLTPSERRIVELAATGMSNREIAEAQFVTVKAVEWHLNHAYRKLGIKSRAHLPRLIAESEGAWKKEATPKNRPR